MNWVVERDEWSCYGSRWRRRSPGEPVNCSPWYSRATVYGGLDKVQIESFYC